MLYEMELDLELTKQLLIPALFPSYEDGNPEDYDINLTDTGLKVTRIMGEG
jgi:hypothetical protein